MLQQFNNKLAVLAVKIARGFVGEDQGGVVGKGPGDRNPLLFATAQLRRPVGCTIAETYPVKQEKRPLAIDPAVRHHRQEHVFDGSQLRQEIVRLEYDSDASIAETRRCSEPEPRDILILYDGFTAVRPIEGANDIEERRLAGTRGAGKGNEFTRLDAQGDVS